MKEDKKTEYVCLNCGKYMTAEEAEEQTAETGWDEPICCGGTMIKADV